MHTRRGGSGLKNYVIHRQEFYDPNHTITYPHEGGSCTPMK